MSFLSFSFEEFPFSVFHIQCCVSSFGAFGHAFILKVLISWRGDEEADTGVSDTWSTGYSLNPVRLSVCGLFLRTKKPHRERKTTESEDLAERISRIAGGSQEDRWAGKGFESCWNRFFHSMFVGGSSAITVRFGRLSV